MRAIWRGAVSFGLVSIAVKLYSATEEKDIRFHQVHRADAGRIRYKRTCEVCGAEVGYDDIAKGYDLGDGQTIVLTDDDLADLPLTSSHAIDVLEFVPGDQVDPITYNRAYYLEPQEIATRPYVLLRDALAASDRVAVAKVALRQREQLATLRVRDRVLVLNTMLWPDEVRTPDFGFLDQDVRVRPQELTMARSLIDSMSVDFDPDLYTDDYRRALQEVIDAKVGGREVVTPVPEQPPGAVVDLMAALRASVERARAGREEPAGSRPASRSAGGPAARKAAKKATPSKTAPDEAPAKRAPAKRAAAKKSAAEADKPARHGADQASAKQSGRARKSA